MTAELNTPTELETRTRNAYNDRAMKSLVDNCKRQRRDRLIATGCVGLVIICLAVGCVGTLLQPYFR